MIKSYDMNHICKLLLANNGSETSRVLKALEAGKDSRAEGAFARAQVPKNRLACDANRYSEILFDNSFFLEHLGEGFYGAVHLLTRVGGHE